MILPWKKFNRHPPARQIAFGEMLAAVVLANMVPVFTKTLYDTGWTPIILYFCTLLIMSIMLGVHEMMALERGARWGMTKSDIGGTVISTLTGGVVGPLLFFHGLQFIKASEAIVLTSALPFFMVIFAIIFLGERLNWQTFFGGLFIAAGIVVLLWDKILATEISPGVPMLLCSAALGALTTIVHKKFIVHRHLDSIVLVRTLLSTTLVGLWLLMNEPESFKMLAGPQNMWLLLSLPIFGFLFPFFLYYRSLREVKTVEAGVISATGRVMGIILAASILGETLTATHSISITCIVFGILFVNVPLTRRRIIPSRIPEGGPLRK